MKITLYNLNKLDISPKLGDRIFLSWDLWAWKTTFSKYIINELLWVRQEVISPTYTYYNKYKTKNNTHIYHFDLYRLKNYDEFFNIAGEDIFDDENNIILVEWPEIISEYYKPTIKINISKTVEENCREVEVEEKT